MAGEGKNDDGSRPPIRVRGGSTGTVEQAKVQKAGRCSRGSLLGIKVAAALHYSCSRWCRFLTLQRLGAHHRSVLIRVSWLTLLSRLAFRLRACLYFLAVQVGHAYRAQSTISRDHVLVEVLANDVLPRYATYVVAIYSTDDECLCRPADLRSFTIHLSEHKKKRNKPAFRAPGTGAAWLARCCARPARTRQDRTAC